MTGMVLISVERIKLFSTRSPYWCLGAIVAASLLIPVAIGLGDQGRQAIPYFALRGVGLGLSIFMVMTALAVTTEYRFSTVRSTFLAVPKRINVLLAKTALLAGLGAVVGLLCALGAFFLTKVLAKEPPEPLVLQGEVWREVAGYAALFAIAAVIAISIGTLLRQSAGAIALLLLWPLLIEQLFTLIPTVGPKAGPWLPFAAGDKFVTPTTVTDQFRNAVSATGPTPIQGLLDFLATGVVLWLIAAAVLNKRDA
jgi:ABC-2 type transport system permease protein